MISQPESAFAPEPAPPILESIDPLLELVGEQPPTPAEPSVVPFVPPGDFLEAYGLRENPFPDSVQPAFFFRTESHADAFRSMMLAVDFQTSLGLVTGPSGTGKTLITQLLLQGLDPLRNRVVLVLVTPGLSKTGLLREILAELGVAIPMGVGQVQDLVRLISNHIIELHAEARRLVLMIDEAHLLSADCLHLARSLSNIETLEQKLSTCLLFGESRLAQRLEHPTFASLQNRIFLRATLDPLSLGDVVQYVKFRLMTVGRLHDLFTSGAFAALHKHSGGIPRSINKIAMLSLLEGALRQSEMIDEETVAAAAKRL